ncbi:MAG: cofactor-independent phosphoglycerate mutase [Candidatus Delongbacteria bacterium]|nr:cofactor-independent phosphoglycerate mutase [Candidatus Delongbacteria bacterium]MCG2761313.1 cofactor-independent phosphoglycerate mutase [Candidatus Delongbacteria bacterium]
MKYIIILGDGMSDYPIEKLGGKTPLMAADITNIDKLAKMGRCGLFRTVPDELPPGSEVANMAVLGYDVRKLYQGRGVLEAASMGVKLNSDDLAMRCNLICIQDGKIKNHSAGHISSEESHQLIDALNNEFANEFQLFHKGVSYRHLFVLKNGRKELKLTPPHDVPGTPFNNVMPESLIPEADDTCRILSDLISRSQKILKDHPVNIKRTAEGKDPANSVWFWSAGYKPEMKTLKELYGKTGAVISAVDLLYGIGAYAGMDIIHVEGATGLYTTNYEGKAKAAVEALKSHDLVYLHIEATDEAGHEGNVELKIKALEYLDKRVVKYIMEETAKFDEPVAIAVTPDHATPCSVRTHTHDPVPFIIYRPGEEPDTVTEYNETSVEKGYYGLIKDDQFIKAIFGIK